MYCTVAQARAAGCTGTDDEVTGWIARAQAVVDAYTQQAFEPTDLTVAGTVSSRMRILLPRRVRTISAVRLGTGPGDTEYTVPVSAYRVTSSAVLGQVDAVQLAEFGYNDLVAGAESYAGGWAGLWGRWGSDALVDGSFGYDAPPSGVDLATAMVAAWSQAIATGQGTPGGGVAPGGIQVDDEGNNVVIEPAGADADAGGGPSAPRATTGVPQADVLLSLYRNDHTLIGGA
ncbi:hypothetical protein [Kitasatospora sp. CB01950]|uniref:hypothetical protein n=1 Tax=Kitasatospora sp. CB01950 TaxID=1703930 RepID=UPI00093AA337|nr:hypothetical protein [Kitasatospora sp. CB01950]OKJ06821.1 hypothetical protein AMK19_23520 [Kitasatospora sp. CB01950]